MCWWLRRLLLPFAALHTLSLFHCICVGVCVSCETVELLQRPLLQLLLHQDESYEHPLLRPQGQACECIIISSR